MKKELLEKYKRELAYVDKLLKRLYAIKQKQLKDISMELEDLQQEIILPVYSAIEQYDQKFISQEKVSLYIYLKNLVKRLVNNIIRDKYRQQFQPYENMDTTFLQIPENVEDMLGKSYEKPIFTQLSKEEIKNLLKSKISDARSQYLVISLLVENQPIKKVAKKLHLSRQRVYQLYHVELQRLKEIFKSPEDLFC